MQEDGDGESFLIPDARRRRGDGESFLLLLVLDWILFMFFFL
jgi:hypothetical protein